MTRKLRYTQHARERMAQRGLSRADAEFAVANFHTRMPSGKEGTVKLIATRSGRRITVVVPEDNHQLIISIWSN